MLNLVNSVLNYFNLELIKKPDKKCNICEKHISFFVGCCSSIKWHVIV